MPNQKKKTNWINSAAKKGGDATPKSAKTLIP
jgi:hypothetical protein